MKKFIIGLILVVGLCATAIYAINDAAHGEVTQDNVGSFTETTGNTVTAEGGNVSNLNIYSNMSTYRWQGYVGNVSGDLSLGRDNNTLYHFGSAEIDTVFATTSSDYAWATLEASTAAEVDTQWGFSDGADQAVDAYTDSNDIEGITVPTVTLEGAHVCGLFDDGSVAAKTNFAFGANVTEGGMAGFDGDFYEYEVMVPTPAQSTETYYFYVSLVE